MREVRITGAIGAELEGVDLSGPISEDLAGALRDALARHLLIVVREQDIGPEQHRRITEIFGAPAVNPYAPGPVEHPEMTRIVKEADERTGVFGGGWHSDLSFLERPPGGSVLYAVEVPPWGGDTMWASMQAAWEALPEPLKLLLDGRDAVHVGKPYGVKWAPPVEEQAMKGSTRRGDPEADRERFHPAVLTHPVTGRRGLYLNPTYVMRLDGMSEEESRPVLDQIWRHCALPEFGCRLRWRAGTLAVWDNYATQHYAINDYHGYRREMRRATFEGRPMTEWAVAA
ncbi:MAG: TauD/TfdA family dioxygenase [Pseudomonadota bacterium]